MMPRAEVAGQCGCGRSPTGKCVGWHALTEDQYRAKKASMIQQYIVSRPKKSGSVEVHAQVAALSDLDIRIAIVLGIYLAIMLLIALLAHLLTKKYNDK